MCVVFCFFVSSLVLYHVMLMKLELLIVGITGFLVYNAYHDGKYTKLFFSYKKYFQMALLALAGLSIYLLIKRDPHQCKKLLLHANNVVKYMPIDKSSLDMLNPIMDFTHLGSGGGSDSVMSVLSGNPNTNMITGNEGQLGGGVKPTKRCVSETKKKYIASRQNWRCGKCHQQLNHTFEIDHRVRLEYGGTNDADNLIALCRNCHGEKTALENMG